MAEVCRLARHRLLCAGIEQTLAKVRLAPPRLIRRKAAHAVAQQPLEHVSGLALDRWWRGVRRAFAPVAVPRGPAQLSARCAPHLAKGARCEWSLAQRVRLVGCVCDLNVRRRVGGRVGWLSRHNLEQAAHIRGSSLRERGYALVQGIEQRERACLRRQASSRLAGRQLRA